MKALLTPFFSRKFLLAVAAFCTAVANNEWGAATTIVMGYLGFNTASAVSKSIKK